MAERIHELLLRNLQEVFGEGDPAKRRAAIKELYADDCVIYVPPGILVGHDALDKFFAGDLRATTLTLPTRPITLDGRRKSKRSKLIAIATGTHGENRHDQWNGSRITV